VDHLHEHFVIPTQIKNACYVAPLTPGAGAEIKAQSLVDYDYATGSVWKSRK
jgi:L-fuconate dehydratase